jgi:arylsulfatase A-like enzyme
MSHRILLFAFLALLVAAAQAADRPHIVYLLADDVGWHDLGFVSKEIRTPNIDRLAEAALRLNQFYVQPYSSQTRAALLTGRYPMRYGLQTLSILPESAHGLPADERTLAEALKQAGYRTALVGKWQLGHASAAMRPTRRGFDYHYGPLMGQVDPFSHAGTAGPDWWRNDKRVKEKGYATTLLGNDAARLIAQHDPKTPLFLMVSLTAPAAPLAAPGEHLARNGHIRDETRRTYAAMLSAVDDAVGAVLAALDKRGMAGDTLVVFHSDNGGAVAHKHPSGDGDVSRGAADNSPYRDGKGSLYEGGVRVPALVRWPGRIEPGVTNALLHVTDMYTTLVELAGGSLDQRKPVDGIDQRGALTDGTPGRRSEVLLAVEEFRGAIRVGDWKLVMYSAMPPRVELYDVPHDPGEEDNAADRNPERVKQLRARLDEYAWEMVPSLHLEALGRPHKTSLPMVWGANPIRYGAGSDADSRRDPSLTVERADRQ